MGVVFAKVLGYFAIQMMPQSVFMNKAEDAEEEMSRGFKEFWDLK